MTPPIDLTELLRLADPPEVATPGCQECKTRASDDYSLPCEDCRATFAARACDDMPRLIAELEAARSVARAARDLSAFLPAELISHHYVHALAMALSAYDAATKGGG